MSADLRTFVTTRFGCPTCRKTYSRKSSAQKHADRCVHDEANRTCRTCILHIINEGDPETGCPAWEGCEIGLGETPAGPFGPASWHFQRGCDGWKPATNPEGS